MRSVQKASSHVLWKIEIFIGEDTRSTVHRTMTPQAPSITISCPIIFTQISLVVWNLFPFKGDFSFGKAKSHRAPNLGYMGAESPGWFDISPKTLHKAWCMRGHTWCRDEAADHHLPTAATVWIIQIVSVEGWSSLSQNLMQICCSSCSVILNVTATQYTCSLNGIYLPTDYYSGVVIVHACTSQSTLLGCKVTLILCKLFSY